MLNGSVKHFVADHHKPNWYYYMEIENSNNSKQPNYILIYKVYF